MVQREVGAGVDEGLVDRFLQDHAAERQVPAGDALGEGDHVGDDLPALDAEVVPEAAEAGDDLVGDQQHLVLVADGADALEVAGRRHDDAADALHRLGDERADGVRALALDDALELVGAGDAAVGIRQVELAAVAERPRHAHDPCAAAARSTCGSTASR